jgi:hypothetical protein
MPTGLAGAMVDCNTLIPLAPALGGDATPASVADAVRVFDA